MLDGKDLSRLMDESWLDPDGELDDELKAMGVEPEAFLKVMMGVSHLALQDLLLGKEKPSLVMCNQFLCGFQLGHKVALENEMRRLSGKE